MNNSLRGVQNDITYSMSILDALEKHLRQAIFKTQLNKAVSEKQNLQSNPTEIPFDNQSIQYKWIISIVLLTMPTTVETQLVMGKIDLSFWSEFWILKTCH